MAKDIIIKPLITEKSDDLSENLGKYTFVVHKKANKVEIKKEIEATYGVTVESVNTAIMPGKSKVRNTRAGISRGRVSGYKKAIISLSEGDEIDFYGDM